MTRLVLLAVLPVALIVGVAYAVVIVPDRDEIAGNVLTTASLTSAGEPFAVQADATFLSPDFAMSVEATQTLTVPPACAITDPSQTFAIAAVPGENSVPTATWAVTCPAGTHELSATATVEITDPRYFDSDPSDNSMSDSMTVVVEG